MFGALHGQIFGALFGSSTAGGAEPDPPSLFSPMVAPGGIDMSNYALVLGSAASADASTVTSSSQQFSVVLAAKQAWVFRSSVACRINQGANPTASTAAGSAYIAAGEAVLVDGALGAKLAVVREGAVDGGATLTRVRSVRVS